MERVSSTVKSYMDYLGYGFIANPYPGDARDIYVSGHQVPIRLGIGKRLLKGETVSFRVVPGSRGLRAIDLEFPATAEVNPEPLKS